MSRVGGYRRVRGCRILQEGAEEEEEEEEAKCFPKVVHEGEGGGKWASKRKWEMGKWLMETPARYNEKDKPHALNPFPDPALGTDSATQKPNSCDRKERKCVSVL